MACKLFLQVIVNSEFDNSVGFFTYWDVKKQPTWIQKFLFYKPFKNSILTLNCWWRIESHQSGSRWNLISLISRNDKSLDHSCSCLFIRYSRVLRSYMYRLSEGKLWIQQSKLFFCVLQLKIDEMVDHFFLHGFSTTSIIRATVHIYCYYLSFQQNWTWLLKGALLETSGATFL